MQQAEARRPSQAAVARERAVSLRATQANMRSQRTTAVAGRWRGQPACTAEVRLELFEADLAVLVVLDARRELARLHVGTSSPIPERKANAVLRVCACVGLVV